MIVILCFPVVMLPAYTAGNHKMRPVYLLIRLLLYSMLTALEAYSYL